MPIGTDRRANATAIKREMASLRSRSASADGKMQGVIARTREHAMVLAKLETMYAKFEKHADGGVLTPLATELRKTRMLLGKTKVAYENASTEAAVASTHLRTFVMETLQHVNRIAADIAQVEGMMPPSDEQASERAAAVAAFTNIAPASASDPRVYSTFMVHANPRRDPSARKLLYISGPGGRPHLPGADAAKTRAQASTPAPPEPIDPDDDDAEPIRRT